MGRVRVCVCATQPTFGMVRVHGSARGHDRALNGTSGPRLPGHGCAVGPSAAMPRRSAALVGLPRYTSIRGRGWNTSIGVSSGLEWYLDWHWTMRNRCAGASAPPPTKPGWPIARCQPRAFGEIGAAPADRLRSGIGVTEGTRTPDLQGHNLAL